MDRILIRCLVRLSGLAAAALLAAAPAAADWLVTKEGARVETRGAWKEKGKLVVFTLADGTLSSLRADQVDMEASRRATAEAKARIAAATEAKPRRPSVRSITDKDFPRPASAAPAGEGAGEGAAAEGAGEGAAGAAAADAGAGAAEGAAPQQGAEGQQQALQVVTWERDERTKSGVRLTGMLRNNSDDQATGIELVAGLYDETGALVARKNADLEADHLGPGESTPFSVEVPGTFAFSGVKFQMRSTGFKLRVVPVPNT